MEKQFRHTADNYIYVKDLQFTLAEFLELEPEYSLPEEFIGREYFPKKAHRLYTDRNEIFLDRTWAKGDEYIKKYAEYKKAIKSKEKNSDK